MFSPFPIMLQLSRILTPVYLLCVIFVSSFGAAYAQAQTEPCWEIGTCGEFANDPLTFMLTPFDSVFAGFSLVVFWALLCGILWLRSHNPMLVGMIGTAMVGADVIRDGVPGGGRNTTRDRRGVIGSTPAGGLKTTRPLVGVALGMRRWGTVVMGSRSSKAPRLTMTPSDVCA